MTLRSREPSLISVCVWETCSTKRKRFSVLFSLTCVCCSLIWCTLERRRSNLRGTGAVTVLWCCRVISCMGGMVSPMSPSRAAPFFTNKTPSFTDTLTGSQCVLVPGIRFLIFISTCHSRSSLYFRVNSSSLVNTIGSRSKLVLLSLRCCLSESTSRMAL